MDSLTGKDKKYIIFHVHVFVGETKSGCKICIFSAKNNASKKRKERLGIRIDVILLRVTSVAETYILQVSDP